MCKSTLRPPREVVENHSFHPCYLPGKPQDQMVVPAIRAKTYLIQPRRNSLDPHQPLTRAAPRPPAWWDPHQASTKIKIKYQNMTGEIARLMQCAIPAKLAWVVFTEKRPPFLATYRSPHVRWTDPDPDATLVSHSHGGHFSVQSHNVLSNVLQITQVCSQTLAH